jgi:hypothetical protein
MIDIDFSLDSLWELREYFFTVKQENFRIRWYAKSGKIGEVKLIEGAFADSEWHRIQEWVPAFAGEEWWTKYEGHAELIYKRPNLNYEVSRVRCVLPSVEEDATITYTST